MTWLQQGKRPNSVTAVTQQLQPENNPKVDDDATINTYLWHCHGYFGTLMELAHWS